MKIARKNFVIPTGGRLDTEYLEAMSEEMADMAIPRIFPIRFQD